ncbi:MAG: SUMF1/EgtB/PvdO family nonheme iron enzyme, partial [Phycisphaerae bacterium]
GSDDSNADETPRHERSLPAFYIDVTEVTCAQYARYLKATGAAPPPDWRGAAVPEGRAEKPVTYVTWLDAMKYAVWAGKRLPTEAEWEKAARGTDGRRYPWGETASKDMANLGTGKLCPVGQYPKGASPYGCLDMAGNAWEWTADWYEPYPGSTVRSFAFGYQYKVMRGAGAAYFYGANDETGRCCFRGRVLPYAGDLYLGFRCVKDVDPHKAPYNPRKLIAEVERQLKGSLPKVRQLSYEREFADYVKSTRFPIEIAGCTGQLGFVRGGVPFPSGLVKDIRQIRVLGPDGKPRPTQQKMLTPWKDGSARWVLLDFPAAAGEKCVVTFNQAGATPSPGAIKVRSDADRITVDTGKAAFVFAKEGLLKEMRCGSDVACRNTDIALVLDSGRLRPLPAERMELEERGPLHATVRLTGWFADEAGAKSPIQYDLRAHMLTGSTRANLLLTLTHLQPRKGKTEDRTPMLKIVDAAVRFGLPAPSSQMIMATDAGVVSGPTGGKCELVQHDTSRYTIYRDDRQIGAGTRAPGWLAVQTPTGWLSVGVRHFWQNYTKALVVTPNEAVLRLWAGKEPLEFEATIAKTHEIVLEVSPEAPTASKHIDLDPLRLTMAPAWACGTQALGGPKLPRCRESIAHMPYWELARESGMQRWMRAMCYGWRDFGDTRHGGETKGANAFHNLEYDVPFNFLLQYLTTGHSWYLDAAEIQCRHQADIDTDHVTGQPYKHMVYHTTWYADIAHMFLRGLILHYWTTGEARSLEVARQIADHIAPQAEKNQNFGNERQIGWGLYALTGMYEATLDEKYLKAASKLCDTLVAGESPEGKFNIRWDNRMSLMNGMAMNGMISVQELTGDKRLADGILRLARRTLAFYPDYALRTLHGYAWALTRTNDPRYLDVLDKSWRACLDHIVKGCDATDAEVHAWRFPWFAVKYGLYPLFEEVPDSLPDYATWAGQWIPGESAELFIRCVKGEPAPVMIVRHGMAVGKIEVLGTNDKPVQAIELNNVSLLYQPAAFTLPADSGTCRIRLAAPQGFGWEIHHDAKSMVTIYDPKAEHLNDIVPLAYGYLKPGTREVRVVSEAAGEGFHGATLYDPDGHPVASVRRFIDFHDPNRYEVELRASINDPRTDGWGLEVCNLKVLSASGLQPYWASDRRNLFNPEREDR